MALLGRLGSGSAFPGDWACFGAVGAAALFACFLAQLYELVPELGKLLTLRGEKIAHTLLSVSPFTLIVRTSCLDFRRWP